MKKFKVYFVVITGLVLFTVFLNYQGNKSGENENFETVNIAGDEVSVLAFTSPYCYACKNQEKIVNSLKSEMKDGTIFEFIDVTKQRRETNYYQVAVVPTLVIIRHGMEVERFTGRQSEPEIKKVIERELGRKHCFDGTLC